jgi:hypothetical protein
MPCRTPACTTPSSSAYYNTSLVVLFPFFIPHCHPQEFGVDVQQSALLSVLPWFVTILVSNSSGWIADGLANSGRLSMTNTRKLLQTIGSVGPALALLYLATAHNNPGELEMGEAVGALTATLALGGFQSAGTCCGAGFPAHIAGLITAQCCTWCVDDVFADCIEHASCAVLHPCHAAACWFKQGAQRHHTPCPGAAMLSTSHALVFLSLMLLVTVSCLLLLLLPAFLQALLPITKTSAADMQPCCLVSACEHPCWTLLGCICVITHSV